MMEGIFVHRNFGEFEMVGDKESCLHTEKLRCHLVVMRGYRSNAQPARQSITQTNKRNFYIGVLSKENVKETPTHCAYGEASFINAGAMCLFDFPQRAYSHHHERKEQKNFK
jgi:hypothetical protein